MTSLTFGSTCSSDLSEYEKLRLANIERNEEFLKSMGFGKDSKQVHSAVPSSTRKRKNSSLRFEDANIVEPRRRSRRIQQLPSEQRDDEDYFKEEDMRISNSTKEIPLKVDEEAVGGKMRVTCEELRALINEHFEKNGSDAEVSDEVSTHSSRTQLFMVFFRSSCFNIHCIE